MEKLKYKKIMGLLEIRDSNVKTVTVYALDACQINNLGDSFVLSSQIIISKILNTKAKSFSKSHEFLIRRCNWS